MRTIKESFSGRKEMTPDGNLALYERMMKVANIWINVQYNLPYTIYNIPYI